MTVVCLNFAEVCLLQVLCPDFYGLSMFWTYFVDFEVFFFYSLNHFRQNYFLVVKKRSSDSFVNLALRIVLMLLMVCFRTRERPCSSTIQP